MSLPISCYLVLLLFTAGYVRLARWAFLRTRDVSLIVGGFILYFWTLFGAWPFIADASTGYTGFRLGMGYYYLMEKMFPFEVDQDYFNAILLYGTFLVGVGSAWWFRLRGPRQPDDQEAAPFTVDHRRLLTMGGVAMVFGLACVWPEIREAMTTDQSIYVVVQQATGLRAIGHALLNNITACCLVLGFAIRLSETSSDPLFISDHGKWSRWAYPVALLVMGLYMAMIGDRHPLFINAIASVLLLMRTSFWWGARRSSVLLGICAGAILLGGWVRSYKWSEIAMLEKYETPNPVPYPYELQLIEHIPAKKGKLASILEPFWTNEMFAAHFSMYGVLRKEVPLAPGTSFNYLAHAFIPSFLAERPPTAYDHYAKEADLAPGQGYTIHQATAWYINIGWVGPFLGGSVLGLVWMFARTFRPTWSYIRSWPWAMVPILFVAFLPQLVRSGPEAYKALVVEGIGIPMTIILGAGALLNKPSKEVRHA